MANTDLDAGSARAGGKSHLGQSQAAFLLLLPFLAVYALFLVYPFFRGFWISLHDWNLLAVAFNPDAKEFVGLRNYERVMWGRNIEWAAFASPFLQGLGLLGILAGGVLGYRGSISRATAPCLPGARLPPETQLAARFDSHHHTLRRQRKGT